MQRENTRHGTQEQRKGPQLNKTCYREISSCSKWQGREGKRTRAIKISPLTIRLWEGVVRRRLARHEGAMQLRRGLVSITLSPRTLPGPECIPVRASSQLLLYNPYHGCAERNLRSPLMRVLTAIRPLGGFCISDHFKTGFSHTPPKSAKCTCTALGKQDPERSVSQTPNEALTNEGTPAHDAQPTCQGPHIQRLGQKGE